MVDKKHESIILPIYGMAVPFHISTLKNASKSDEGDFVMLRLNFITPGQAGGKKEDLVSTMWYRYWKNNYIDHRLHSLSMTPVQPSFAPLLSEAQTPVAWQKFSAA